MVDFGSIIDFLKEFLHKQINDPTTIFALILVILGLLIFSILAKLDFLEVVERWTDREIVKLGKKKFVISLIILALCLVGVFFTCFAIFTLSIQQINTNALTDYFSIKFLNEIQPKSEAEISQIVTEAKSIPDVTKKLERIAEWETNNFTDIYWHHVSMKSLNPNVDSYLYESTGKIRAVNSYFTSPYAGDPDWIQYYKFGACGEEASLFGNVTNRTGFPTRLVVLDLGSWYHGIPSPTGNHAFVEVQMSNGEWYFFDPTVYGADHVLNESPCKNGNTCENRWFGKPEDYSYFSSDQVLGVYLNDTREDVSNRYTKISVNIMKSRSPLRIGTGNGNLSLPETNGGVGGEPPRKRKNHYSGKNPSTFSGLFQLLPESVV